MGGGDKDRPLSLFHGDWNFTTHAHDRYNEGNGAWAGHKQAKESSSCAQLVADRYEFFEPFQPLHNHEDGLVPSRLDGIY